MVCPFSNHRRRPPPTTSGAFRGECGGNWSAMSKDCFYCRLIDQQSELPALIVREFRRNHGWQWVLKRKFQKEKATTGSPSRGEVSDLIRYQAAWDMSSEASLASRRAIISFRRAPRSHGIWVSHLSASAMTAFSQRCFVFMSLPRYSMPLVAVLRLICP